MHLLGAVFSVAWAERQREMSQPGIVTHPRRLRAFLEWLAALPAVSEEGVMDAESRAHLARSTPPGHGAPGTHGWVWRGIACLVPCPSLGGLALASLAEAMPPDAAWSRDLFTMQWRVLAHLALQGSLEQGATPAQGNQGETMPFLLTGRVALVTGAGRGIGRATARILADAGCDLVLVGRDATALTAVAGEVADAGRTAVVAPGDVRASDLAARVIADTLARFGRLDILVNNAGTLSSGAIEEIEEDTWQEMLATNLSAAYRFCRVAFGPMRQQAWGRMINIASITAQTGEAAYITGATLDVNGGILKR
jgi:hypothetical protein